ncbi:MAG: hypothetical protein ABW321_29820 [Polyangiales bacterium]
MTANTQPTRLSARKAVAASEPTSHPLLTLDAQLLPELPCPVALRLDVPGAPVPVCIWTGRLDAQARAALPVLADTIVFDGAELAALVCATEADRVWHADFLGLCFEKWRNPEMRVERAALLDGANPDLTNVWSLNRVLQRLGIQLDAVEIDTMPVARALHAAVAA